MRRAFRLAALSAAMLCAVSTASAFEEQGNQQMDFQRQFNGTEPSITGSLEPVPVLQGNPHRMPALT